MRSFLALYVARDARNNPILFSNHIYCILNSKTTAIYTAYYRNDSQPLSPKLDFLFQNASLDEREALIYDKYRLDILDVMIIFSSPDYTGEPNS